MAVLFFEFLPALLVNRTVVIKADEEYLGPPAQTVSDMVRGGMAAGELLLAVRAIVFLPGNFVAAFVDKHP